MNNIKNISLAAVSFVGGVIAHALGGWDMLIKCLIVFIVTDYITGLTVAFVFQKSKKTKGGGASSEICFKGIVKKVCILVLVGVGVCMDNIMGTSYIRFVTIMFFIGNEGLSILENMELMGIPFPAFIRRALEILRDNGDKGETNNTNN